MAEDRTTHRLMDADETMSPVDLPGSTLIGGAPLRWTTVVIATASLFLLFTNAATLDGWAKELPPSALAERLTTATTGWMELTDRLGLGAPRAFVHREWKRVEAAQFQGDTARP